MVRLAQRPHWFLVLLEQVRPHLVSYLVSGKLHGRGPAGWRNETRLGTSVRRNGLGILGGKTSGYFLTSKCSGYFRFIGGYVLTSNICGSWSSGSQTSLTIYQYFCRYIYFRSEFHFRSEFISGSTFILRPPRAMTGLTWRRPVLHQDGSQRVSDRFPGALRRIPTRRDLRYG